ncbi:MAG: PLP-dependent aminotransferase family protein [Desulfobulbaceae bacterium]|nr:MAG: PLP-dependent aminotransferase family protein [Desulfobulbaceae bacterium]
MSLYSIDRDSDIPLYIQIRENIIEAIRTGELQPGDKLPSVTKLSQEIGVTQATIRRALQDLGESGKTECYVGRGTFIKDADTVAQIDVTEISVDGAAQSIGNVAKNHPPAPREFAARRLRTGVSKALYDIMPLAHKPGIIQLTKGVPDPGHIPDGFLEKLSSETLQDGSRHLLQATNPLGFYDLRVEIANRFNAEAGTAVSPDQVMITNGSIQALTLIAESMLETNHHMLCETPCFQGIADTFTAMGHWVETVPRDDDGPVLDKLIKDHGSQSHVLYLCPYAHNPMGTNLSKSRYEGIVEWAQRSGSIIIADEIFKDLLYEKNQLPSLMAGLGSEQTIIVSSISKSVMTGLRLGWLIGSTERVRKLAQLKRLMDYSCPTIVQAMGLTLFNSGTYDAHRKKMRKLYQKRMEVMIRSLERMMPPGVSWTAPVGGFSIFVKLPQGYSSVALLLSAIDKGVSFLPGPLFDIDHRYLSSLRLSTAYADENKIKEGIELLASAIETFTRQPPEDSGLSGLGGFQ